MLGRDAACNFCACKLPVKITGTAWEATPHTIYPLKLGQTFEELRQAMLENSTYHCGSTDRAQETSIDFGFPTSAHLDMPLA